MTLLARRYGASPLHLLGHLACFAVALWAVSHLVDARNALNIAAWFVGALILHDALVLPLYATLDRGATLTALRSSGAINFVRVPVALSLLLLLVYLPTVLGRNAGAFAAVSGLRFDDRLGSWLLLSASFFALSAIAFVATARGRAERLPAPSPPRDRRPRGW